jgi:hypothetical protein
MCTHTHVCISVHMHVLMRAFMVMYIYICVYTSTHMHVSTHLRARVNKETGQPLISLEMTSTSFAPSLPSYVDAHVQVPLSPPPPPSPPPLFPSLPNGIMRNLPICRGERMREGGREENKRPKWGRKDRT